MSAANKVVLQTFVDALAEAVADRVAELIGTPPATERDRTEPTWLDAHRAADHLGLHVDTVRRLAARREIPFEQDGPGCRLWFKRDELDAWRSRGGRGSSRPLGSP